MESYLNENFDLKAKNSSDEALQRWRKLCWVVKNKKRRFRFTSAMRSEAQTILLSNQHSDDSSSNGYVAISIAEDTEYEDAHSHFEDAHSHSEDAHSHSEITSLVSILFYTSISLEVLSVVFDQLSSPQKPRYAFAGMLCANVAVLLCILELINKCITERELLASQNDIHSVIMEMLPEITGLGVAIFQSISAAVQFYYFSRHADNRLKVSLVGIYIGLCLSLLKFRRN